jgi:hypothetical protein
MRRHTEPIRKSITLLFVVSAVLIAQGCGTGSSSSSRTAPTSNTTADFAQAAAGNAEGLKVVEFGHEASPKEREAASRVLRQNLKARAAGDWAGQCSSLSPRQTKELTERDELFTGKKGAGTCAKGLELEAEPLPPSVRKDPLAGSVEVLLVKGRKAYALFKGSDGGSYAMPMVEARGSWTVDQLTTIEIGKG